MNLQGVSAHQAKHSCSYLLISLVPLCFFSPSTGASPRVRPSSTTKRWSTAAISLLISTVAMTTLWRSLLFCITMGTFCCSVSMTNWHLLLGSSPYSWDCFAWCRLSWFLYCVSFRFTRCMKATWVYYFIVRSWDLQPNERIGYWNQFNMSANMITKCVSITDHPSWNGVKTHWGSTFQVNEIN